MTFSSNRHNCVQRLHWFQRKSLEIKIRGAKLFLKMAFMRGKSLFPISGGKFLKGHGDQHYQSNYIFGSAHTPLDTMCTIFKTPYKSHTKCRFEKSYQSTSGEWCRVIMHLFLRGLSGMRVVSEKTEFSFLYFCDKWHLVIVLEMFCNSIPRPSKASVWSV